jgi:hypothetical protein
MKISFIDESKITICKYIYKMREFSKQQQKEILKELYEAKRKLHMFPDQNEGIMAKCSGACLYSVMY